jgi:hypothetical protein
VPWCVNRIILNALGDGLVHSHTANLRGVFSINWFHNLAHVAIGVLGLAAAGGTNTGRLYVRTVGIAYAGLFMIGLFTGNFLDILPLNAPDNVLHLASAIAALATGFTGLGLQPLDQRGSVATSARGV